MVNYIGTPEVTNLDSACQLFKNDTILPKLANLINTPPHNTFFGKTVLNIEE